MATIGVCLFSAPADFSPVFRRHVVSASGKLVKLWNPFLKPLAVWTEEQPSTAATTTTTRNFVEKKTSSDDEERVDDVEESDSYKRRKSLKDYLDEAKELIRSDGGQPHWFCPIECGCHTPDSPLLLYLPGMDGVGLGLTMQHQRLGKIFDVWCLHIPVKDRTSFTGLVKLIEKKVKVENSHLPKRPIYLVGESLGACLALAVASRNPQIDLILILSNPATSYSNSVLQQTVPLLGLIPDQVTSLCYMLSLITGPSGDPWKMVMDSVVKGLSLQSTVEELSQNLVKLSSYLPVLADIFPKETLLWKLELLKSASAYANARLHAVKAQTLILCSGKDQLLPSQEEGQRLCHALPNCQMRMLENSGHFLFMEDGVDLVTIIKGASFYRRGNNLDYVSDFMLPTTPEFNKVFENMRWMSVVTSPVMFSTLEDGKIVRGLSGIPSEGPVLFVGYHNLLGFEVMPLIPQFLLERNILVRGIAHPMMFYQQRERGSLDLSSFDTVRLMGAVPVSASNFYRLMSSKSYALLYPGGVREALHRKGEEYKLFWPEQSEFVRMAARFGAKIIPFGAVGEDDIAELVFDYNDQMKIPYLKSIIEEETNGVIKLRTDASGEVANQQMHWPYFVPKVPGRFYYHFGKPIETEGMKHELRDREKSHELYLQVKSEVEKSLAYLKEKREHDPYRKLLPRLVYLATNGFTSEVPTFEP
ncbi:hypothetical protein Ddye_004639 [Dipteronia dyeriana]|uniref:Serine aminopeptidase S33 domain-containing protein n=1 Tax=Dipteronia dyeriana TaxID=168575 RepID=A0AAD9XVI6_9ROSI|nr:hypothetical protein Ddye_004639 [Dipteronia dyeriana]